MSKSACQVYPNSIDAWFKSHLQYISKYLDSTSNSEKINTNGTSLVRIFRDLLRSPKKKTLQKNVHLTSIRTCAISSPGLLGCAAALAPSAHGFDHLAGRAVAHLAPDVAQLDDAGAAEPLAVAAPEPGDNGGRHWHTIQLQDQHANC